MRILFKKRRKKQKYPRKGKLKEEYESVERLWRRKKSEKLSIEGHASATYSARSLHHLFSPQWRSISSQLSPLFEKSILATPRQWADIYIHWFSLHPCCVHTRIHVQQANFFVLRGSRAKSSSFRRISNFIVCFDTRFRVATETTLLPCWRLREPILSERVFPPPCENIGYSNFFHTLVSYYSSVSPWQSYLIGLNIELLEHVGME